MKAVLMSIQPKWVEKIAKGEKTIEVRKIRPKLETPFKVYIYVTQPKKRFDYGLWRDKWGGGVVHKINYETAKQMNMEIVSGKVIGEFVCNEIKYISPTYGYLDARCIGGSGYILDKCCLAAKELIEYGKGKSLYGWHISDLKIYDKPKVMSEFSRYAPEYTVKDGSKYGRVLVNPLKRPPQSWCYVEI